MDLVPARQHWTPFGPLAISITIVLAVFLIAAARSQQPAATEYLPSVSDLMIATIQPRHQRLWRAAQAHDWDFAAYELGNLQGAFRRLERAHPEVHNASLPDIIASLTEQPFNDLKRAIEVKDNGAFVKAYGELTDACNSCHQALNHGVVAIGVPNGEPGSDLKAVKAP
jgi:hypothetical protein